MFREGQGVVVEGYLSKNNYLIAVNRVFAKHDENYMPASIKKQIEKSRLLEKKLLMLSQIGFFSSSHYGDAMNFFNIIFLY